MLTGIALPSRAATRQCVCAAYQAVLCHCIEPIRCVSGASAHE